MKNSTLLLSVVLYGRVVKLFRIKVKVEMKILVIEDSVVDVEYIRRMMKSSGEEYELTVAEDGNKAINLIKAQNQHYDVVVLDINLPKYNGHDVLELMKSLPYYDATPVIVASTSSDPFDVGESKRLGANGYLVKGSPFTVSDLHRLIDQGKNEWLEILQ